MRVKTSQEKGFADQFIDIPDTELDSLEGLIDWESLLGYLREIEGDYDSVSLFKVLLLQTWFNLSDASVSHALCRDVVFMRFCGLSLDGKKPNASTICRFRSRLVDSGSLDSLLSLVNTLWGTSKQLSRRGLKLANGKYVSCDATLISSARRPRKRLEGEPVDEHNHYEANETLYSDDTDASWKNKGSQSVYGYAGFVTTDEHGLVEAVSTP